MLTSYVTVHLRRGLVKPPDQAGGKHQAALGGAKGT